MKIQDLIDERFAGCISVRKNEDIVFQNAYGYSDLSNKIKNEIDTRFAATSAGKVFDVNSFWDCLFNGKLISKKMLDKMLSMQSLSDSEFYGYGIWLDRVNDDKYYPYFQGCDPGVSFISSYDTEENINITVVSNFGRNVWKLRQEIKNELKHNFE